MSAESKSEASDRLRGSTSDVSPSSTVPSTMASAATPSTSQPVGATTSTISGQQDEQHHKSNKTSYSVNKQQMAATALHQHYLNYFNSNISKEEAKSHRTRGNIFNSYSQHPQQQAITLNQEFQNPHANHSITNQRSSNHQHQHQSPRVLNQNSAHIYHISPTNVPPNQHHYANPNISSSNNLTRSVIKDETIAPYRFQQQQSQLNQRAYSTGALPPNLQQSQMHQRQAKDGPSKISAYNFRQDQLDRDSEETTTIKEELENDLEGYKNSELEALSSLERNLPIELSFLIRQQAHCMAKMNYLDRQVRELKEAANHQQQVDMNHVSSTSIPNRNHASRPINNIAAATMTHTKNGNFILSDDSGGEYSRATISDDDELSSLLDQIAKTVRPEQRNINDNMLINSDNQIQYLQQQQQQHHQQQSYQQQRLSTAYNAMVSNQQKPYQQPYTIINPNQLQHQQTVPIFVMSSPIAVAHPSSISSNILPGVHFQPEPRYNQYYDDFYAVNNAPSSANTAPTASSVQRQALNSNTYRSQHFDNSISAVEQLVSQKEKRQIISQLKSADNWLKMRTANTSSSLFNQQESSLKNVGNKQATMTTSDETQEQVDVASMR